jgi:hypothetical protein
VVVLATRLEQVGVIRNQHGRHPAGPQRSSDGLFSDPYGSPWSPREVKGANKNVVSSRHAGQRPDVVLLEAQCALAKLKAEDTTTLPTTGGHSLANLATEEATTVHVFSPPLADPTFSDRTEDRPRR